jgi:signal transduction histidine kinase
LGFLEASIHDATPLDSNFLTLILLLLKTFLVSLNTCPDIAEPKLTNIFKKFYRVVGNDPNAQPGTGLGLALVKIS